MFCTKKREICKKKKKCEYQIWRNFESGFERFRVAYLMSVNRSSAARNLSYSWTEFIVVILCLLGPLGIVLVVFRISSFIGAAVTYVLVRSSLFADLLGLVTTKPEARLIVQTRRRIFLVFIIIVKSDMDSKIVCRFFVSFNRIVSRENNSERWNVRVVSRILNSEDENNSGFEWETN